MRRSFLNQIRSHKLNTGRGKYLYLCFIIVLGLLLGRLAKTFDNTLVIGDIGTNFGIWIFIATLISVYSSGPVRASINTLAFFLSMLLTYYMTTYFVFHFLPTSYIEIWIVAAFISAFIAMIIWYGKGKGWLSAIISSVPIACLLIEAYPFLYTDKIALFPDFIFALILFIILANTSRQKVMLILIILCDLLAFTFINSTIVL